MKHTPQHIIFDLDGTIIDSKNEILKTYKLVFSTVRPDTPPDFDKLNLSLTLQGVFQSVYSIDELDKITEAKKLFSSVYDTSDYEETSLYTGVMATLQYLKDQGHEMYIATNKRLFPTKRILEIKGINELFSGIMANEMQTGITPTKRQMIAELKKSGGFEEGFMVGDSVSDIMAGNAEKLVTIAVTYGYEHAGLLAAQNPNYTIDNFGELKTIIVP